MSKRSDQLRTTRDALQIEIGNAHKEMLSPVVQVLPSMVEAFSRGVRRKLEDAGFAKRYLQLFVEQIVVSESTITIRGSSVSVRRLPSCSRRAN